MSAAQIAILVAICSITFGLGVLLVGGFVLFVEPRELRRVAGMLPNVLTNTALARVIGAACLVAVIAYAVGSAFRMPPLVIGKFRIDYPRASIALSQFVAAPLELIGAAGILYFALPEAGNPGFLVVLAIFVGSFTAALVSNAPAGAGVFDLLFINALPSIPGAESPRGRADVPPLLSADPRSRSRSSSSLCSSVAASTGFCIPGPRRRPTFRPKASRPNAPRREPRGNGCSSSVVGPPQTKNDAHRREPGASFLKPETSRDQAR